MNALKESLNKLKKKSFFSLGHKDKKKGEEQEEAQEENKDMALVEADFVVNSNQMVRKELFKKYYA